ncbi:MAG: ArsR/SmtB family transcription factor [Candidatus Thorarchaeota archaeon]
MNNTEKDADSSKEIEIIDEQKERIEKLIEETDLKKVCCSANDWVKQMNKVVDESQVDFYSSILRVISNPIRLKILFILMNRDWACNCEFESAFNVHQTLISHHLRNLRNGGFIIYEKRGQWKFYSLTKEARLFLEKLNEILDISPKPKKVIK